MIFGCSDICHPDCITHLEEMEPEGDVCLSAYSEGGGEDTVNTAAGIQGVCPSLESDSANKVNGEKDIDMKRASSIN